MLEEDIDDTHLCIKCSATIVGLDNYVQHRKTNCGGKTTRTTIVAGYGSFEYPDASSYAKSDATGGKTSKTLSDPYDLPYELDADVFFSSLQLQSVQANSGGKTSSGQQILTRKATATLLSSGRDETEGDWHEEAPNNTDNLMKVVRDIGETKKFEPIFKPIAFTHESPEPDQSDDDDDDEEDFDDDDDDEDYVPTPYSGGKWKPGSQPSPRSGAKWKNRVQAQPEIPATHTGGKWNFKMAASENSKWKPYAKPSVAESVNKPTPDLLSQIRAKLKSNSEYVPKDATDGPTSPEAPETGGKWKPGFSKFPIAGKWKTSDGQESPEVLEAQTGGKWKPGCSKTLKLHVPPLTGGKWKSSEALESPEIPYTHTGGKWKPGDEPSTGGKWKPVDEPSTGGKWKPGDEQLTGGKWKPGDRPTNLKVSPETPTWDDQEPWEEATDTHPPVEHTKGKWVPGTKVDRLEYKEEVLPAPQDFWCNICCRKLKTKTIYEKHLKSGVHLRKSETEQQLERAAVEQLELSQQILRPPPLLLDRTVSPEPDSGKRKRRKTYIRCAICKHRMHSYLVGKHLISHYHYVRMRLNPEGSFGMILDNIHQIVLQSPFQCSPCRFYANTEENFLNHWNSTAHRDRTEGPGKFWCSFCRFECEDNNQMRRHLLGTDHREVILAINRSVPIYISKKVTIECPKCHQGFRFNMELRQHAMRCDGAKIAPIGTASDEYQSRFRCELCPDEVLKSKAALQRHEKFKHNKRRYYCSVCAIDFESAIQAIKHRKTKSHKTISAQKLTQKNKDANIKSNQEGTCENFRCKKCDHVSSSEVEAVLHQIAHPGSCKKNNEKPSATPPKPVKHNLIDSPRRKCFHCKKSFKTKPELKAHLNSIHPDAKHICPLCGEGFTLPQELSSHRRYNVCVASTSKQQSSASPTSTSTATNDPGLEKSWKCSDCTFSSIFESELIFHRIIHTKGVEALQLETKLKCPLCEKSFTKHSLRLHLRQHTNEKTFTCEICKRSFSRRHNYKEHMQYLHAVGGVKQRKRGRSNDESFICDTCGKIFRTKYSLKLHINIHTTERDKQFQCPVEHCQYIGRNRAALNMHKNTHMLKMEVKCQEKGCKYLGKSAYHLKRHMKNHLVPEKVYKCNECNFKAKIPGHIRRHVRVHTGECPYQCPHCDYRSGYIENLRKHILTTKKHPGKFIYTCTQCDPTKPYETNYNSEFQVHLTTVHPT